MKDWQSQAHVKWDCKDHAAVMPKYGQRVFLGQRKKHIGEILRDLCRQKEIGLMQGNAQPDHVHRLLCMPPKFSAAMTLGHLPSRRPRH